MEKYNGSQYYKAYSEVYNKVSGKLTEENIKYIIEEKEK
jgi:hypothetical protein